MLRKARNEINYMSFQMKFWVWIFHVGYMLAEDLKSRRFITVMGHCSYTSGTHYDII